MALVIRITIWIILPVLIAFIMLTLGELITTVIMAIAHSALIISTVHFLEVALDGTQVLDGILASDGILDFTMVLTIGAMAYLLATFIGAYIPITTLIYGVAASEEADLLVEADITALLEAVASEIMPITDLDQAVVAKMA